MGSCCLQVRFVRRPKLSPQRIGKEILYFRSRGFEPLVIPGVSSAIAAPTFAGIPITQRNLAEPIIICRGVGRNVLLPGYVRSRTLILFMGAVHLSQIITALVDGPGVAFPPYTPTATLDTNGE